jgi:6-phosphogluconolactonase/glucosamine-6-phosphate isomerase/deaminase
MARLALPTRTRHNESMSETYELEPELPTPDLPGHVVVQPTDGEVADAIAADLFQHAMNCVRAHGDFHIALPSGVSPLKLYTTLMIDPAYREMPWKRTHLWMVSADARDQSTVEALQETIVLHGDIPRDQFHPMDAGIPNAADVYSNTLKEHLGWREKGHDRLDYVLLGVGQDGSTAGYRDSESMPNGSDQLVYQSGANGSFSMSLSMRLINASRFVAIVATGKHKRPGIQHMIGRDSGTLPILHVKPVGGVLKWYLDQDACPPTGENQ